MALAQQHGPRSCMGLMREDVLHVAQDGALAMAMHSPESATTKVTRWNESVSFGQPFLIEAGGSGDSRPCLEWVGIARQDMSTPSADSVWQPSQKALNYSCKSSVRVGSVTLSVGLAFPSRPSHAPCTVKTGAGTALKHAIMKLGTGQRRMHMANACMVNFNPDCDKPERDTLLF